MRINVTFDTRMLEAKTQKQIKNLAFSTAQALNDTAKDIQYRVQGDVRQSFRLRKAAGQKGLDGAPADLSAATDGPSRSERSWLVRQIAVLAWANVRRERAYAEVGIRARQRLLLAKYDKSATDSMREPFKGRSVATPITRHTRQGGMIARPIDRALTFRALKFKPRRTKSGALQIKGLQRTFVLRGSARHPLGGVYQRVGPGRGDIQMLYSFRRAFRLRKVFDLIGRAREMYVSSFRENFYRRLLHLAR